MASQSPHLLSTFLLEPLSYSLSSDINHIHLHVFPHTLSFSATSNSTLLTPLSFIVLHILLLVHHGVTGLSLLSTLYPLAYKLFLSSIPTLYLSATHPLLILLLLLFYIFYHSNYLLPCLFL